MAESTVLAGIVGLAAPDARVLRDFARSRGESPALVAARLAALEACLAEPSPDRSRHLWRFTDPARLLPAVPFVPVAAPAPASVPAPAPDEAVVWLDGGAVRLSGAAASCGVRIVPLADAGPEFDRLGAAVPAGHGPFEALNLAAWTGGVLLALPRGRVLDAPLRIVVTAGAGVTLPRLLVLAGDGAGATVIEEHRGGASAARVVGVTELFVAPGARLRHVLVQRWTDGTAGHLTTRAVLDRGATLITAVASLGGSVAKLDLGAVLAGEGARSELYGVALADGLQHLDHHTRHDHRAPRTTSQLDFKAVAGGSARSAYTGLIRIDEHAPGSEAYQENRNLLLADGARIDSIPELEILTDEVSCTHGATVAPVDPEQLFYLRSRGLPAPTALRLVVRGFLEATLRRLPDGLRAEVEALVATRLAALGGEG